MEKEEIIKLAEQNKIKLSEEEIKIINNEMNILLEKSKVLEDINTDNIEPIFSPLENIVVNRFGSDEVLITDKEDLELIYNRDRMIEDFYQVPNKEGN